MKRLAGLLLGLLFVVLAPRLAFGQTCNRSCAAELRDARGCCPALAATPPPIRPAAAATPPKPAECTDGTSMGPDTAGHCCWTGQVWASTRCVGVPASCPANRRVDAKTQECALISCETGMVRTDDNVHCCFAKQGWSGTRNVCVGVPQCPKGLEAEGETCVPVDKDGDGILNAADKCPNDAEDKDGFQDDDGCPDNDNDGDKILDVNDKCPNEAEDFNQFKDDDGCPDEAELKGARAQDEEKARMAAVTAAAEAADHERAEAERRKLAAERDAVAAAQRDKAARKRRARDEEEGRSVRRTMGQILTIGGGVVGAASVGFMIAGNAQNSSIQSGNLATGKDIQAAAASGETYNVLAVGFGVVGVGGLAIGLPLWLLNGQPEGSSSPHVALTVGPGELRLQGQF